MEAEVVYVPYDKNISIDKPCTAYPVDNDSTKEAVALIKKMVADGWNIVATVPVNGGFAMPNDSTLVYEGFSLTFTKGYEVWLQR